MKSLPASFFALLLLVSPLHSAPPSCESTTYLGQPAYRLSNGVVEAVVVPRFAARMMHFGKVSGENWLWNIPKGQFVPGKFTNWGGDKTFLGPHPLWKTHSGAIWPPPDASWEAEAQAEMLPGGGLRTTGAVWNTFGTRVIREFGWEAASGAFTITQTLEKVSGEPRLAALWQVAQLVPPEKVYVPLPAQSAYRQGFFAFGKLPANAVLHPASTGALLAITPQPGGSYKLGFDAPVPAIAAVRGTEVLVLRTDLEKGDYPDGAHGAGFPIEFYNHVDQGPGAYVELELLSTLQRLAEGKRMTNRIRWSFATLPAAEAEREAAVLQLLR